MSLSSWVLLIWVTTGTVYQVDEVGFYTREACEVAATWANETSDRRWVANKSPKAACFKR